MNGADIIAATIAIGAIIASIYGYTTGIIRQICALAALFLGYIGAYMFGARIGHSLGINTMLSCALVFLLIYITVIMVARVLHVTVKMILLGPINSILGALFGLMQWLLMASLTLNVLYDSGLIDASLLASQMTHWTLNLLPRLLNCL